MEVEESGPPTWFKHVRGNLCSTKTLPKDGMRPQLIPEHENECLSPVQTKIPKLYECMEDEKAVDPVRLDLCDYQAIEPVHPFYLLREDLDSLTGLSI